MKKTDPDLAFMEPTAEEEKGDRKDSCLENLFRKLLSTIVLSAGEKKKKKAQIGSCDIITEETSFG